MATVMQMVGDALKFLGVRTENDVFIAPDSDMLNGKSWNHFSLVGGDALTKFKVANAVGDTEAVNKGQLSNLDIDSIKIGDDGVYQILKHNELQQYASNGWHGLLNMADNGSSIGLYLRDKDNNYMEGIKILANGTMVKDSTNKDIPDFQPINIYIADESNIHITNENIWGDTNVGIENVSISGFVVNNMAVLSIRLKISGFSATLPTDSALYFRYNILNRLKQYTDITAIKRAYAIGLIDTNQDTFNIPCQVYAFAPGEIVFHIEDSGMGGSGASNTSVTATSFYAYTTIAFEVIR